MAATGFDSSVNFLQHDDRSGYKSLNRNMMDDQAHYEDPRAGKDWESDEDSELDSLYEATILQNTIYNQIDEIEGNKCKFSYDVCSIQPGVCPTSMDGRPPAAAVVPNSQRAKSGIILGALSAGMKAEPLCLNPPSAVMRAKSPMLMVTSVPLVRESVDGEYVLPNDAFGGELLSPTEEELSDYIDIA